MTSFFDRITRRTTRRTTPWNVSPPGNGITLLHNRTALVTGGAGVLGSAISEHLAAWGAKVIINYRSKREEAESLADRIRAGGGTAVALEADIRDPLQVQEMIREASGTLGSPDILVNNAAPGPTDVARKGFLDHTWGDYQTYIDTILLGAVNCCQATLPGMIARGRGRIVNIGTTALNEINAQVNPYVTAKGGLLGMTRSLAEEFGKHHITVNEVVPGCIWSEEREPSGEEGRLFRDRSPLGIGLARPSDVAGAVVFLASDMASMITGAYIPVCAGQIVTG